MAQNQNQIRKSKSLGLFGLVLVGLSGAFGYEIFVLLDYAYYNLAGPATLIAIALGGALNFLIMLSYSELSAAMPKVGGEYTYIKTAYGGYISFIFGSFRWLAAIFAATLSAITFVLQLSYLSSTIYPPLQTIIIDNIWAISIFVVIIMGIFEVRGSKQFGDTIVILFILLFVAFIVGGLISGFGSATLSSVELPAGISGLFAATVYMLPLFIGTRAMVASAANSRRPDKDLPTGILLTALMIIPLYISIALIAVGAATPEAIQQQIPLLSFAAGRIFGNYGSAIFSIAGIVACLIGLGTALSVQSSVSRGMSRDGYLPRILQSVHSRFGTHHIAAVVGVAFIILLSTVGAVPFFGYAASFGSLIVFALVNLSLMRLRKTKPYMDRPFKTPLYPITPIIGVIISLILFIAPILLGDGNAIEALTSSSGLIGIVLVSYYLRMSGRYRVQIGLGGIGLGVSIFMALSALFNFLGLNFDVLFFVPSFVKIVISLVLFVTGYFNITAGMKKQIRQSDEEKKSSSGLRNRLVKRLKFAA